MKFSSDTNGYITGLRFYKASTNTGTHVANLWTSTGTRLATATFTNETASGWQEVTFASPVAIAANTVYVASYHTTIGHYSDDQYYFADKGIDNPPLHAPRQTRHRGSTAYTPTAPPAASPATAGGVQTTGSMWSFNHEKKEPH